MNLFYGQDLLQFADRFKTDQDCLEYLAHLKWIEGYKCWKYGYADSQIRKDHSRTCNKCSHTESPTANTLFNKLKFGIRKAFFICFELGTTTKSLFASYVAERFSITEKTARLFMHKVGESMKSSLNNPITGEVHVDEFVVGGKEKEKVGRSYDGKKKKVVCALELTEEGKVKRMYANRIDDYSAKELKKFFDKHISEDAKVTTDKWWGYHPLMEVWDITQIESDHGLNFKALHTMIHQLKSWIRTTYSRVSKFNINRYMDEYCYRINRSIFKDNIFNTLIEKMIRTDKIYQSKLICS